MLNLKELSMSDELLQANGLSAVSLEEHVNLVEIKCWALGQKVQSFRSDHDILSQQFRTLITER